MKYPKLEKYLKLGANIKFEPLSYLVLYKCDPYNGQNGQILHPAK